MKDIREIFQKYNTLTIKEIQELLQKEYKVSMPKDILNHRIRSTLYYLQKSKRIKRIANATYQKIK